MTFVKGPPCHKCLHRTADSFDQVPYICEVFPDGLPRNIFFEDEECPHFEEDKTIPKKAAKAEPKPEPKKADKKLIRFQLPANPTAEEIEKLSKWVKGQDEIRDTSNAKPTEKKD